MRKLFHKVLAVSARAFSTMAHASVESDLNKCFTDLGGGSN